MFALNNTQFIHVDLSFRLFLQPKVNNNKLVSIYCKCEEVSKESSKTAVAVVIKTNGEASKMGNLSVEVGTKINFVTEGPYTIAPEGVTMEQIGAALIDQGDSRGELSFIAKRLFRDRTTTPEDDKKLKTRFMELLKENEGKFLQQRINGHEMVWVPIGHYWLGKYMVQNSQWELFEKDTGYAGRVKYGGDFDLPDHPVVGVSLIDVQKFLDWFEKSVPGINVPTREEWESAAMGIDDRTYPWGNEAPDDTRLIWSGNKQRNTTEKVGTCPAGVSPFGALDMAGNAWEWTCSPYEYRERKSSEQLIDELISRKYLPEEPRRRFDKE